MKLDIFAVYDVKAGSYATPFFAPNISHAQRSFAFAANDSNTDVNRYPSDFSLWHLGTFNAETAEFDLVPPFQLCLAVALLNRDEVSDNV